MNRRTFNLVSVVVLLAMLALSLGPVWPKGEPVTTLKLVLKPGTDIQTYVTAIYVTTPPGSLVITWATSAQGAAGITWQVRDAGSDSGKLLVSGSIALNETGVANNSYFSSIPASFLSPSVPKHPVPYYLCVTPFDKSQKPLSGHSNFVVITQGPQKLSLNPEFPSQLHPTVHFLRYKAGPYKNIPPAGNVPDGGAVMLRLSNPGKVATAPVSLRIDDLSGLVVDNTEIKIPSLAPNASMVITRELAPVLDWGVNKVKEIADVYGNWFVALEKKGVNLWAVTHAWENQNTFLYKGKVDSCKDGKKDGDEIITDCGGSCGCCNSPKMDADHWRQFNGFSFTNGKEFTQLVGNYDFGDLQNVFGDCSIYHWPCVPPPTPHATTFLVIVNSALRNGECFGMARASMSFIRGNVSPFPFAFPSWGGDDPSQPKPPPPQGFFCDVFHLVGIGFNNGSNVSPDLARYIKRQHLRQASNEGLLHYLTSSYSNIQSIKSDILAEGNTIVSISQGFKGHAMVAHHIEDRPDGGFDILVYDPNVEVTHDELNDPSLHAKNQALSRIHVNANKTYSFDDQHNVKFSGNISDIVIYPYSMLKNVTMPGSGPLPVAFSQIDGDGVQVKQITDDNGHRYYRDDGTVNQDPATRIPGLKQFIPMGGGNFVQKPLWVADGKSVYTHVITTDRRQSKYSVRFVGQGYSTRFEDIPLAARGVDKFTVDPSGAGIRFETSAAEKILSGQVSAQGNDKHERVVEVSVKVVAQQPVKLAFDEKRELVRYTHAGPATQLQVTLWSTHSADSKVQSEPIPVQDGDVVTLAPNWTTLKRSPGTVRTQRRRGAQSERPIR